ncbi:MAG: N-acetylglutaminylglutamine amidotransferase [Gammaproteobacteria bacterium]|nr:MAG: N-acetylglutaminylglutamine amidotransferase [Gammaproteobacteria bacterium]
MCGLFGALSFDQKAINPELAERMSARVARRGPDDRGEFFDGPVMLGHRRLSIIDLSPAGHQPMQDFSRRFAIVFNGTIYNYPELREQLIDKGYRFNSHSDTEVIVNAYACWGEACVERLHGMFAFAIWDSEQKNLFLARDRMGIKPLYYALAPNGFYFASNPQALLATGLFATDIDPVGLHHQLSLHAVIPAPRTLLKSIRKCRPAFSMRVTTDSNVVEQRYWTLRAHRPAQPMTADEWNQAIHDSLMQAVKKRLTIADVPVGVLLSGGLDSSLLVALLAESGQHDIRTFSIGFEDQPEERGNEFEFSDPVAQRYQTDHEKFLVPNDEVLTRLPEAVAAMAEPMFGQDAVAFFLLSEQVSKSVKVVQSGQGADEVFAGYFWYAEMWAAQEEPVLERFAKRYVDRDHVEFCDTVAEPYRGEDHTSELIEENLNTTQADSFLDAVLRFDVTTLIVDDPVKRVDNMTMAWGLEARVPFLDHELVELAASCPPELKLKHDGKGLLKEIARGRIPDAVIDRPKGYFPMPALKYVRGDFYQFMADTLNSRQSRERGLFNRAYIDRLLDQPEQHFTRLNGSKLWHSALLEFWLQQHVDSL